MSSPFAASAAVSASPPPLIERPDFPTWLPAMLVKELRQGLRTRGFVAAFVIFQVIMMVLMLGTVVGSLFGSSSVRGVMVNTISGFFWTLLGAQMLIVTPIRALGSLQAELDSRALDLLVLTRLTAWRIVLGKWGSLLAQALLLFVAMLPYGIVRYFLGSVNLLEDAERAGAMVGGCALLTAAGLASSGMPKFARRGAIIVAVVGFKPLTELMMYFGYRGSSGSPFGIGTSSADAWVWWFNGAVLLGLFLVTAVRRIAPPAENHVIVTRGLALLTLVPLVPLALQTRMMPLRSQLMFAGVTLGVVCALELSSLRWPMAPHWRPWARGGGLARWLGRIALPGWPSALRFLILAGLAVGWAVHLPNVAPVNEAWRASWLVMLAMGWLVFPALLLSFFGRIGRPPLAFLGVLIVLGLLAPAVGLFTSARASYDSSMALTSILPGAGFWITLVVPDKVTDLAYAGQAIVTFAVLGGAVWRSRPYWASVAQLDVRVRTKG